MASPAAILSILVKTQGAQAAAAQLTELNATATKTSATMDKATASSDRHVASTRRLRQGLGSAAKGAVAFVGAYAGFHVVEDAVKTTEDLGHATLNLHRNFGLTVKSASEWAAIAESRGVAGKQLAQGFKTLATQTQQAAAGSKQAKTQFAALGISQDEVKKHGSDMNWVLKQVSDGLHAIPPGTQRASITSKLFGRTWQQLAPILRDGSAAMQATLDKADQYGATFGGRSIKSVEAMVQAQREAKLASMGLSVTIGTTLIPVITKVISGIARFVLAFREGKGGAGQLRDGINSVIAAIAPFAQSVKVIVDWLGRHTTIAKVLIGVLGGLAVAVWAVNAAMAANPITLVITALALLAVGLVTAYRKCAVFRDIVDTVWGVLKTGFGWVKNNWPLLLAILTGPFGLAALLILKHANAIKGLIAGVFNWIKGHWPLLLAVLTGPFGLAVLAIVRHAGDIKNAVIGAFHAMINAIKAMGSVIAGIGTWTINRISDGIHAAFAVLTHAAVWIKDQLVRAFHALADSPIALGSWFVGRFVDGIKKVGDAIKNGAKWIVDKVVGAVKGFLGISSPSKVFEDIGGNMIKGLINGMGKADVLKFIGKHLGGAVKLAGDLAGKVGGAISGTFSGGGGNLRGWLSTALKATGHFSGSNLNALYGRTIQESGGNPKAINLTDSNARAGHPSKGLLQTIDSTFSSYSLPGHGDIWNPIDNAIAAIRYMYATYGHIVGPSGSGYAKGGKVPGSGSGDTVAAMLEPGEFVMRKSIVDKYGPTFFAGLNGMKSGGSVGAIQFGASNLSQYEAGSFDQASALLAYAQAQGDAAGQIAALTTQAIVLFDRITLGQNILKAGAAVDPNAMLTAIADLVNSLHEAEAGIATLSAPPVVAAAENTTATTDLTDNVSELNDTISRLNDQLELQRQEALAAQRAYNVSQSNYAVLAKAIADVTNGQIGGRVGLGYMTPGFAGGGVRY